MTIPDPKTYTFNQHFKSRLTKPLHFAALGRHAFCLRKSHAGDATGSGFPAETLRPRLQVNLVLYGRSEIRNRK